MALKPVDMDDCRNTLKRCLKGPNIGKPYQVGDECPSGYTFNPETCDCDEDE